MRHEYEVFVMSMKITSKPDTDYLQGCQYRSLSTWWSMKTVWETLQTKGENLCNIINIK